MLTQFSCVLEIIHNTILTRTMKLPSLMFTLELISPGQGTAAIVGVACSMPQSL